MEEAKDTTGLKESVFPQEDKLPGLYFLELPGTFLEGNLFTIRLSNHDQEGRHFIPGYRVCL